MARHKRPRAAPATTRTFHGWMFEPLGAREASARSDSTVARSTGVGRKARTDRRVAIASSAGRKVIDLCPFVRTIVAMTKAVNLARHLTEQIESGRYPVGSTIPTEAELQQRFAVSRHT